MSTAPKRAPGAPRNTTIYTEGVDPLIVQLRTEQVRQGLSDYALSKLCGISAQRLGNLWRGSAPTLKALRAVATALRKANPSFTLSDPS